MKLALDARYLNQGSGGISTYIDNLLRSMLEADRSFQVLLITRKADLAARFDAERCADFVFDVEPRSLRTIFLLARVLKNEGIDLFHGPFNILPSGLSVPAVVTVHDVMGIQKPSDIDPRILYRYTAGLFWRSRVRHAVRIADSILTNSWTTRQALLETFPGLSEPKIAVTRLAVDPYFECEVADDTDHLVSEKLGGNFSFVLVVGNESPHKNHFRAVEAFLKAFKDDPALKLVLVRRFLRPQWRLEKLLAGPRARGRVIILGALDKAVLRALYRRALLFFFPSWAEGFGLPILEAMACGCPVLTGNRGAPAEVAGDAALTVSPFDVDEMVASLRRLAGDESLRAKLVMAGKARIRQFSWAKTAAETLDAYRQAISLSRAL
jgi:glycosyltransferase involved in cell wall biosynthesis